MKVWRKKTTRWELNGKRVAPKTEGAKQKVEMSPKYYGTLKTYDGKYKQVALTQDPKTAKTMLRRLQAQEDKLRASGITPKEMALTAPLTGLVMGYKAYLASKNNTPNHIRETINRINVNTDQKVQR